MCKLYVDRVLHGDALKLVSDEMDRLKHRVKELEVELKAAEFENEDLEAEVKLLRIIKQTLEMQSGMKFDI
jgi:predicted  nucleic acid-binding Zn-ribbon protein